jgi:hypothetical protein
VSCDRRFDECRHLVVQDPAGGDLAIHSLLPHLLRCEIVHLTWARLDDSAIPTLASALAGLPRLRDLSLEFNRIGDRGFIALFQGIEAGRLSRLDVSSNLSFGDDAVVAGLLPWLARGPAGLPLSLCARASTLSPDGISALADHLFSARGGSSSLGSPGQPIVHLDLSNSKGFAARGAEQVGRLVEASVGLLRLSGCGLGHAAGRLLFSGGQSWPAVTVLDLSGNNLGPLSEGARVIDAPLLAELDLSGNQLAGRGLRGLMSVLPATVAGLNLANNRICNLEQRPFAQLSSGRQQLESLVLDDNDGIGSVFVIQMVHDLASFRMIRSLSLQRCSVGYNGALALARALTWSEGQEELVLPFLESLRLEDNALSTVGTEAIFRALLSREGSWGDEDDDDQEGPRRQRLVEVLLAGLDVVTEPESAEAGAEFLRGCRPRSFSVSANSDQLLAVVLAGAVHSKVENLSIKASAFGPLSLAVLCEVIEARTLRTLNAHDVRPFSDRGVCNRIHAAMVASSNTELRTIEAMIPSDSLLVGTLARNHENWRKRCLHRHQCASAIEALHSLLTTTITLAGQSRPIPSHEANSLLGPIINSALNHLQAS